MAASPGLVQRTEDCSGPYRARPRLPGRERRTQEQAFRPLAAGSVIPPGAHREVGLQSVKVIRQPDAAAFLAAAGAFLAEREALHNLPLAIAAQCLADPTR